MENKKFKKYESIENSYREAFIDKIRFSGFNSEIFHVEEKIHGANFQFYITDNEVSAGKRTSFLKEGEKFFNWRPIFERYSEIMKEMKEYYFPKHTVIVYGELYGGSYPHPDVDQSSKWTSVQKEVFYRTDEDFICFDIFIHNNNESRYLKKSERDKICEQCKIPFSKTLFKGTLTECLSFSNEFQTTIPKELGLPDIEGNFCEGVVIRPENDLRLNTEERAILKNKNEKFSEKKKVAKEIRPQEEIPEFILNMVNNAEAYITENRLQNMISKLGDDLNPKDFGKYIKLFSEDVYGDFFKDFSEEFQSWQKDEQKKFQKVMNGKIVDFLKSNLLTKI